MKKRIIVLFVIFFVVIIELSLVAASQASTVYLYSPLASTVVESRDYATEVLGDPWDMSNREDISHKVLRFSGASMGGGVWSATTTSTDSQFWFLWAGYPGAYASRRDGAANPVNASLYKRLSFRMYIGTSSTAYRRGQFYWFTRKDLKGAKVELFRVFPGWHTYQIDLPSSWSGWPVSLRLDPIDKANVPVKIDWIRLTNRPGTTASLNWVDSSAGEATIYYDNDTVGQDGTSISTVNSIAGSNLTSLDLDGIDSGSYYFYIKKADGSFSNYSAEATTVNQAPFIRVTEPDETGGKDWARSALRNPWDMKSRSDIAKTYNVARSRFSRGIYSGINAKQSANGARKNDPYIMLNLGGKKINTNRFHRLTFRYAFGGGFSLSRGTMSRFGWTTKRHDDPRYWQMSDDIVTYNGWNIITIDLKKIKLNRGGYGWRNYATRFRFDPHEDHWNRKFYIDYVKLTEDDRLSSSFVIRYNLQDSNNSSLTTSIYRDKDRTFGNGNEALITTNVVSTGNNAYRWAPPGSLKGLFWIYVQGNDGVNTSGYYSTGPLRVH